MRLAKIPWDDRTTAARARGAYGRGSGLTIELIQPVDGVSLYSQFLDAHGEGVQHIGFWSPDVLGSVEHAVNEGARVTLAYFDAQNNAVVQLTPADAAQGSVVVGAMRTLPPRTAYVGPQSTGVQLEFCGPSTERFLRGWLQEDFGWLTPPPWETNPH
jgi:hypothetical protein